MKAWSMTHVGRMRETNQDYMYASETAVGCLPSLFLVADGMGGYAAGDFASRYAVERFAEYARSAPRGEPVAIMIDAVKYANEKLYEEAERDPKKKGMGTTLVAAVVEGNKVYAANVGDSRLYVVSRDRISQITRDHSYVEELVRRGEIDRSAARVHPEKNKITRAVGVERQVSVDVFETWLERGDCILMCSDGLTNMVEDLEIRHIVLAEAGLRERAERLIAAANEGGGDDNITVVLIDPFSDDV